MTDKIWLLKREGSEAADCSTDCSYRPIASPIFTLNLRHKFARWIALSKRTFCKSQIRLPATFRLSFWHLFKWRQLAIGVFTLGQYCQTHPYRGWNLTGLPFHFYCLSDAYVSIYAWYLFVYTETTKKKKMDVKMCLLHFKLFALYHALGTTHTHVNSNFLLHFEDCDLSMLKYVSMTI